MLRRLSLQNFRNYSKRTFEFSDKTTLIVGPNAAGKTNILEAIYLLATGKSFRAELEKEVIKEGTEFARVEGDGLAIIFDNRDRFQKTYQVNGVGKRQVDFIGLLRAVLFSPLDMEIVVNSPSTRRRYLDSVLIQVHKDYRLAAHIYERALRQRNRLLWRIREEGLSPTQLDYWNELLITNGKIISDRRREFINFLNDHPSEIFPVQIKYDHSLITPERLAHYATEEIAAAVTLVGPHRDDFQIYSGNQNVKSFGSRGEQRLSIFAIKLGELAFVKDKTSEDPLLLLDDIFSELDPANRHHLLKIIPDQQTIMTTTDVHLVDKSYLEHVRLISL